MKGDRNHAQIRRNPSSQSMNEVKRLREAEVTHARVAMSAAAGIMLQEAFHPLFPNVVGPAIIHIQQIPAPFWQALAAGIAAVEFTRARRGWVEPWLGFGSLFRLREEYIPGDIGFDPLGAQRSYTRGFYDARARELAYGRIGAHRSDLRRHYCQDDSQPCASQRCSRWWRSCCRR